MELGILDGTSQTGPSNLLVKYANRTILSLILVPVYHRRFYPTKYGTIRASIMSDKTPQLAKVRTFADDMKKAKSSDSASSDSSAADTTKGSSKDESVTTTIPKKADTPAPPPPPPQDTKETDASNEQDTTSDTDDTIGAGNPPFHTLEKRKGSRDTDTPNDLDTTAQAVSEHPESILDSNAKKHLEVGKEESGDATIVSDRKRAKSSLFSGIATELTNWASNFKNTYITPPKPSYRVNRSERRAGVLHQAVGSTGTANVEHGSIEERIRNRYQANRPQSDTDNHDEDAHVDPVFLPELPPGEDAMARATDATTTPRKSIQSKQPEPDTDEEQIPTPTTPTPPSIEPDDDSDSDLTPIPAPDASLSEEVPAEDTDSSAEEKTVTTTTPDATTTPETEAPATVQKPAAESESATVVTPDQEIDEAPQDTARATSDATSTAPAEPVPKPTPQPQAAAAETQTPAPTPDVPAEPEPTPTTTQTSTPEATTTAPAPAEPEPTPTAPQTPAPDAQQPAAEPAAPTPQPAYEEPAEVPTEPYDEELDEEERQRLEEQAQTNRLSFQIVSGVVGVVVLAVLGYGVASLFMDGDAGIQTEHVVGDAATTLVLTDYVQSHDAALQALLTAATDTGGEITQVTPFVETEEGHRPAAASELEQYLGITIPDAVSTNVQQVHFGFRNDAPFMYLNITDERQTFGALLRWEQTMAPDVEMLFGVASVDDFRDADVAGYDARVGYQGDTPVLTYAVVEGYVFITTTPAILERLIPSRR